MFQTQPSRPQRLKRRNIGLFSGIFSLSMVALLSSGCAGGGGGWVMPPPIVVTSPALSQPWVVTYSTSGTLEANNMVDLNSEMSGIVSSIYVREGSTVGRGATLMRLKADKQMAQVQQSEAGISSSLGSLEQQKADIQQAKARLDSATVRKNFAESELKRFEKLFQDQFISQLELDQKRNNFDTALASFQEAQQALSSAQARLRQAASGVNQARSLYSYNMAVASDSLIRAPFGGLIGQKYVDIGDYVSPGQKLMTVVDPSTFKIQFDVPERYLEQIKPGLAVNAAFEGIDNKTFTGQVNFIDPVVDTNAHTVKLKAIIPQTGPLRHGLFGTVSLALGTIPNAVVIPEEAIVPQGEKTFVYVVRHEMFNPPAAPGAKAKPGHVADVAHLQEVVVGHREARLVQVQSGLNAGERVITSGLQKVNDNQEVNLNAKPNASAGAKGQ